MIPLTILRSLFNHGFVKDLMFIFEQIKETTYSGLLVHPSEVKHPFVHQENQQDYLTVSVSLEKDSQTKHESFFSYFRY